MTIHTNIPTGSTARLRRGPDEIKFAAMFGLGLLGFAFGKKKPIGRRVPTLLCLVLFSAAISGVVGCSTQQLGASSTNGTATPAGTFSVLVTAKQVGSQVITSSGVSTTVYGNGNQMSLPFTINVTVQ